MRSLNGCFSRLLCRDHRAIIMRAGRRGVIICLTFAPRGNIHGNKCKMSHAQTCISPAHSAHAIRQVASHIHGLEAVCFTGNSSDARYTPLKICITLSLLLCTRPSRLHRRYHTNDNASNTPRRYIAQLSRRATRTKIARFSPRRIEQLDSRNPGGSARETRNSDPAFHLERNHLTLKPATTHLDSISPADFAERDFCFVKLVLENVCVGGVRVSRK